MSQERGCYSQISFLGEQEEPAVKFKTNTNHRDTSLHAFVRTSDGECVQSACTWHLLLSKLIWDSLTEDRAGPCMRQGGTLNSFISRTIPGLCRERKGVACWWDAASAPKTDWPPLSFGSVRILFGPHWPIGSSPPAAVEMAVWVPAKWGAQMCSWWGRGKMLLEASADSVLSNSPDRRKRTSPNLLR